MDALRTRVLNLVYEYKYVLHPSIFNKATFHLDYEGKVYRQEELVKIIRDTITHFALTPQEFATLSVKGDIGEMQRISWGRISKAKKFKKGDYGELLLYIVLAIIYNVPKFVTKVRLRSSIKEQIKGFDCAHFTVEHNEAVLWLGEAKFHKNFSNALADATKSINDHFSHAYLKDEISILGSNIEANNNVDLTELEKAFLGKSLDKVKFRVPILLTYDSDNVKNCTDVNETFKSDLEKELEKHYSSIDKKAFSITPNVELMFIIFPLHTVAEIKTQLETVETISR